MADDLQQNMQSFDGNVSPSNAYLCTDDKGSDHDCDDNGDDNGVDGDDDVHDKVIALQKKGRHFWHMLMCRQVRSRHLGLACPGRHDMRSAQCEAGL